MTPACLDPQEIKGLRGPEEREVKSAARVHQPLEDPQGTLVTLDFLVKMELLEHLVHLDLKVIPALLEVKDGVATLENQ